LRLHYIYIFLFAICIADFMTFNSLKMRATVVYYFVVLFFSWRCVVSASLSVFLCHPSTLSANSSLVK